MYYFDVQILMLFLWLPHMWLTCGSHRTLVTHLFHQENKREVTEGSCHRRVRRLCDTTGTVPTVVMGRHLGLGACRFYI